MSKGWGGNGMSLPNSALEQFGCESCGYLFPADEILINFGVCDTCFLLAPCPCDNNLFDVCPIHGPEGLQK